MKESAISKSKTYIAVDLGAETGRVMLGSIRADKLTIKEIHRFNNKPVNEGNSLRWDFGKLLGQVKVGIAKAVKRADDKITGMGIDSWGVDFGLVDAGGELLENPYHYRDGRTNEMIEKASGLMPRREIYEHTGVQFLQFNTIYQLLAMRLANYDVLAKARNLIFIADLVAYYLCGRVFAEYTLSSTSQLMDMRTGQWSRPVFDKLSLPIEIMPEVVRPGTIVGRLSREIAGQIGCDQIDVIAVGSHDTASAVAAVPADNGNRVYISSGTWSLIGVEVADAIINDTSFEYSFTNEGGVEDTIRFLKNVMGLWLVQECRRKWQSEETGLSYSELTKMAEAAQPFAAYIDPDYNEFLLPGNMPEKINCFLSGTAQKTITDKGLIVRAILESLALKYRWVIEKLEAITPRTIDWVNMVGGGIQNELLCQFTANAAGKVVCAGPVEATAVGNILIQAKAVGQIKKLTQARKIVRNSFELRTYQPTDGSVWKEKYQEFTEKLGLTES